MNQLKNKITLGFFPTPLEYLEKFSKKYGSNIYMKRDDQTGLATGGNKTRKLEYLIKDALDLGADTVITVGGPQSNHCRQTAAAAIKAGLKCHLIVRGEKPEVFQGNLLLDKILGAEIHFAGDKDLFQEITSLVEKLKSEGKKPYKITMGGSDRVGVKGYVNAVEELKNQMQTMNLKFDKIYFSTSSGGTQAGLVLGVKIFDLQAEIIGMSNDKGNMDGLPLEDYILKITKEAQSDLGFSDEISVKDILINRNYNEAGYGVITKNEIEAIKELAQTEGILLDPVYTGRAFYGMMDILRKQNSDKKENILFWHTGGVSANFSYAEDLSVI